MAPLNDRKAHNEWMLQTLKKNLFAMKHPVQLKNTNTYDETKLEPVVDQAECSTKAGDILPEENSLTSFLHEDDTCKSMQNNCSVNNLSESKKVAETKEENSVQEDSSEITNKSETGDPSKSVKKCLEEITFDYETIAVDLVSSSSLRLKSLKELCKLSRKENAQAVAFLLKHCYANDLESDAMSNIFIQVCRYKSIDLARVMLNSGIDIDIKDEQYGSTALMHAAQVGNVEMVQFLIDRGADVLLTNASVNKTALDYAINTPVLYLNSNHDGCIEILKNVEGKLKLKEIREKYGDLYYEEFVKYFQDSTHHDSRCKNFKEEYKEEIRAQVIQEISAELVGLMD